MGFRTFETCFLWWMYDSCCTIGKAAVLTLGKTLCRFITNCCGLQCYHPFTLHETQSNTNRKWQRRSPGARAYLHLSLLDHDETVTQMWNLGLLRKNWLWKFGIPLSRFRFLVLVQFIVCTHRVNGFCYESGNLFDSQAFQLQLLLHKHANRPN